MKIIHNNFYKELINSIIDKEYEIFVFTNQLEITKETNISEFNLSKNADIVKVINTDWGIIDDDTSFTLSSNKVVTFNKVGEDIYGYFLKNKDKLYLIDQFSNGPYKILNIKDSITIEIKLGFKKYD